MSLLEGIKARAKSRHVVTSVHGRAAPAPSVAKAYKNLDELLAQLRASFYSGPAAEPPAAEPRAAKDALAEADKLGAARGAGGQAAAPQPPSPEPEYEEYDDGLGARRSTHDTAADTAACSTTAQHLVCWLLMCHLCCAPKGN